MPQSRSPQRPAACPPISPSPPISLGRSCVWRHIESPQPVIRIGLRTTTRYFCCVPQEPQDYDK